MVLGAGEVTPLPLMIWTPSLQRKEVSPAAWRLGGGGERISHSSNQPIRATWWRSCRQLTTQGASTKHLTLVTGQRTHNVHLNQLNGDAPAVNL